MGGRLPKKDGGLGQFADLREGERWGKEGGGGVWIGKKEGGIDTPMYTISFSKILEILGKTLTGL